MNRSTKIGIGIITFLLLSGGAGFWFAQKKSKPQPAALNGGSVLHYASDPTLAISQVDLKVFYFAPKDAGLRQWDQWQPALVEGLRQVVEFYDFQFHKQDFMRAKIYPQAVTGVGDSDFYDGANTGKGNPNALLLARAELIDRALKPGGDLYRTDFASSRPGSFEVLVVLYEGVGSSATIWAKDQPADANDLVLLEQGQWPAMLLSRDYLSRPDLAEFGVTMFAHELGHVFGLADNYDSSTGQPFTAGLMGNGRFRPLNITYLSDESKKSLGLSY